MSAELTTAWGVAVGMETSLLWRVLRKRGPLPWFAFYIAWDLLINIMLLTLYQTVGPQHAYEMWSVTELLITIVVVAAAFESWNLMNSRFRFQWHIAVTSFSMAAGASLMIADKALEMKLRWPDQWLEYVCLFKGTFYCAVAILLGSSAVVQIVRGFGRKRETKHAMLFSFYLAVNAAAYYAIGRSDVNTPKMIIIDRKSVV